MNLCSFLQRRVQLIGDVLALQLLKVLLVLLTLQVKVAFSVYQHCRRCRCHW